MISWLCGRRSMGKSRRCRSGLPVQPVAIWGVSELVNQVSKTSVSARKPPGDLALGLGVARGRVRGGVQGQGLLVGEDRAVEIAFPVRLHRVPHRKGHAEVALAAHAPVELQVLGPVPVAHPHEVGMPGDAVSRLHELRLLVEDADEPLPRRDELEGPVALLVELHGVGDRAGLGGERRLSSPVRGVDAVAQQGDHGLLRLLHALAGQQARRPRSRPRGRGFGKASRPERHRRQMASPAPRSGAGAASAPATTARPSGRRTCRPSGCPCPSPCPRAGSGRSAPAP